MRRSVTVLALVIWIASSMGSEALADSVRGFSDRVQAAMEAESRPVKDKARDANRLPKQTLAFFGIEQDQRVLELLPGGGWYTRLLAPALDGTGQLYLAFAQRMPKQLREAPIMKNVKRLEFDAEMQATEQRGIFGLGPFDFGVRDLDAVLTFRNLHNLTPTARANLNKAVFEVLRPGAVYGVIDHSRRHMEPDEAKNWRRVDPVRVIEEIQAAGFVLEGSSDLHYRPLDPLEREVGDASVAGKTDRFTLRFRKPAS